ncbi:hypothetical protein, partial [Flavobacterium sp. NRK1]|uniref:hypothetical protein n=1 Tax=Flavobacterium sp. NRK1 TaxID=2954929 RepID=UPI002092696C
QYIVSKNFAVIAGAKVANFLLPPNLFSTFFRLFFFNQPFIHKGFVDVSLSVSIALIAGAKVAPFSPFPNFIQPFFNVFLTLFLNCLITRLLQYELFLVL